MLARGRGVYRAEVVAVDETVFLEQTKCAAEERASKTSEAVMAY